MVLVLDNVAMSILGGNTRVTCILQEISGDIVAYREATIVSEKAGKLIQS